MIRWWPILIAVLFSVSIVHAAEGTRGRRPDGGCLVAPVVRIVAVDMVMFAGLWAIWPEAFGPAHYSRKQLGRSFSGPPQWGRQAPLFRLDGDPWVINGPLHAIYGSEAYMAGRDNRFSPFGSFLFAGAATLTWEYLLEGGFQQPSMGDIWWTPFAGAVLGELRFQLMRLVERRVQRPGLKMSLLLLFNPLGQIQQALLR